jgi:hypothetical protein
MNICGQLPRIALIVNAGFGAGQLRPGGTKALADLLKYQSKLTG